MEKIQNAFSTLKERREEKSDIYASYIDRLPVSASRVSCDLSMVLTSMIKPRIKSTVKTVTTLTQKGARKVRLSEERNRRDTKFQDRGKAATCVSMVP